MNNDVEINLLKTLQEENDSLKAKMNELEQEKQKYWKEKQDELSKRINYQYAFETVMEYLLKKKSK